MYEKVKERCIVYFTGVFMYIGAVYAIVRYTIPDRYKFIMFLAAYLMMGVGVFRTLSESLLEKRLPGGLSDNHTGNDRCFWCGQIYGGRSCYASF